MAAIDKLLLPLAGCWFQASSLLHIPIFSGVNAVRWNPASQDEVACTSLSNNEVLIFDIGYVSSEPSEVLRKRPTVSVHGGSVRQGFSDIALSNDDARSGVLDLHHFQVSHIHCPPPPWLDELNAVIPISPSRKPSWLPKHSIYAVGSTSSNGLHLLDFYPHTSSPCHVDYDDSKNPGETFECKFVPLSGLVTACATHPLNGTIVARTVEASLLMISQKHLCKKGDDDDEIHDSLKQ